MGGGDGAQGIAPILVQEAGHLWGSQCRRGATLTGLGFVLGTGAPSLEETVPFP